VPEISLWNGITIINPGSTDRPRFPAPECGTYIIANIIDDEWYFNIKTISEIN
jgi:predicted phosphodiesterase